MSQTSYVCYHISIIIPSKGVSMLITFDLNKECDMLGVCIFASLIVTLNFVLL